MTVIVNNKVHVRNNYKELTDGKFDDCTSEILKNLAAEDSSDSESNAVDKLMDKIKQNLQNMKLRHVGITVVEQQFEFHY